MNNIRNIDDLLKATLGATKEITETKITPLTKPGDNYGSLMLKLDVKLKDKNTNSEIILALVAKKIPCSELYQEIFNIQVTFKKEVALYDTIIPTLSDFFKENVNKTLDFFPKYYASRFSLNEKDDVVDEDGVLVLENLKVSGYENLDRKLGFDFDTAKILLQNLAQFHAVPLALKLKNPTVFNEKIKKFCIGEIFTNDRYEKFNEICREFISENPETVHLAQKINLLNARNVQQVSETYGTLVHLDLWTNNIMLKSVDGKISGIKLVDFQVYRYGSPASDLFFFLWTSVQIKVLKENLDDLIKYYHEHFIKTLQELNCDIGAISLDSLYEELTFHSKFEFGHAFFFSSFIIPDKEKDEAISQMTKEKGWFMVLECEKRGWLPKLF